MDTIITEAGKAPVTDSKDLVSAPMTVCGQASTGITTRQDAGQAPVDSEIIIGTTYKF